MKYNLQVKSKTFTLVGMSGVGKTSISQKLSAEGFFHYSIDYEIAHTHLKERIKECVVSKIKKQSPLFESLIEKFAINLEISLTFDDLEIITMFVIPQEENGKIILSKFLKNQNLYKDAEMHATQAFTHKAKLAFENYHMSGFINDATGSICEVALSNNALLEQIRDCSTVIYLKATDEHQNMLIERSKDKVKPILYNYNFLIQNLKNYYAISKVDDNFAIDKDFFLWVFPNLLEYRRKSYQEFIDKTKGIVVDINKLAKVRDSKDFLELIYEN